MSYGDDISGNRGCVLNSVHLCTLFYDISHSIYDVSIYDVHLCTLFNDISHSIYDISVNRECAPNSVHLFTSSIEISILSYRLLNLGFALISMGIPPTK